MRTHFARSLSAAVAAAVIVATPALAQSGDAPPKATPKKGGSAPTSAPLGQDLPFTPIDQSSYSGYRAAAQLVIQSEADYDAFFHGNAPASPVVDFTREDVVALEMGEEPSGGYAVTVTRIVRNTAGGDVTVFYSSTVPAPGAVGSQAPTTPSCVVKLAKQTGSYGFVDTTPPPPPAYGPLSLAIADPATAWTRILALSPSGKCGLQRIGPQGALVTIGATPTPAETQAVSAAYQAADVATLPASIPDLQPPSPAPPHVTLRSTSGQTTSVEADLDRYGAFDARLRPLVESLRAIAQRIELANPGFDSLTTRSWGGFVAFDDAVSLGRDGSISIDRVDNFTGASTLYTGQATADELCNVSAACGAADVTTLPPTIDDPSPVFDLPSERIVASVGGTTYTTDVTKAGLYDSYAARLGPLTAAIQAIAARVIRETDGQIVSGTVVSAGGSDLSVDGTPLVYDKVLAPLVAAHSGATMTVRAQVSVSGPARLLAIEATVTTRARVHADASSHAKSLGVVRRGASIEVIGASGGYLEVSVAGVTGWIYHGSVRLAD